MMTMNYLVMLYDNEATMVAPGDPGWEAEMAAYGAFSELAGPAIVGGEALLPSSTSRTIRVVGGQVAVTDGPFAETAEVLGGLYVLDVPTLDDAIELVRHIPATATGCSEIRPIEMWMGQSSTPVPEGAVRYLATIHGTESAADVPGTDAWEAGAPAHRQFGMEGGDAVAGGAAVHPTSTATTVRVRDGELSVSDGPYADPASAVIGGLYLLTATPDDAVALAAKIPVPQDGAVDLRPILEFGG
jgi:hypothetical protein